MKRVVVITSCTGKKALPPALSRSVFEAGRPPKIPPNTTTLPAEGMYTGLQHTRLMQGVFAARNAGVEVDVYIISAGYGLVGGGERIASYEVTFKGMSPTDIVSWARKRHIARDVRAVLSEDYDLALLCLGDEYLRACELTDDMYFGGPVQALCGKASAKRLPPTVAATVLTVEDAKKLSCPLIGLKGEVAAQILRGFIPAESVCCTSTEVPLLNVLVAFPYFDKKAKQLLEQHHGVYRLMVDSGAFTAWNAGKPVSLDDYCEFLDSIEHLRPFHAVQLDVIGDEEASWNNYEKMRARGYDVLPVFTRGSSVEALERMYSTTDYVLLGGVATGGGNRNYVKWFSEVGRGRKAHWLGFTSDKFIRALRPTSVDSSSWTGSARFGQIFTFDAKTGEGSLWGKLDFRQRPPAKAVRHLRQLKVPWEAIKLLAKSKAWTGVGPPQWPHTQQFSPEPGSSLLLSTLGYIRKAQWVERVYGTQVYLAAAGGSNLGALFGAFDYGQKIGTWR